MSSYVRSQIRRIRNSDKFKMKITSAQGEETKWLNVTPQQLDEIKEVLRDD